MEPNAPRPTKGVRVFAVSRQQQQPPPPQQPQQQQPPPPPPPPPEPPVPSESRRDEPMETDGDRVPPIESIESRLFGEGDNVIEVPQWRWNRTEDALPPDGRYWEDPETKTARHRHDETYYGPDYVREDMQRKLVMYADLAYQFVETVAGMVGQGTNADQFWKGSAAGGRAVEVIFDNLFTEKPHSGAALPLGTSDADEIRRSAIEDLKRKPIVVDDRKRDAEQALKFGSANAEKLAAMISMSGPIQALGKASGSLDVNKELLNQLLGAGLSSQERAARADPNPLVSDRNLMTEYEAESAAGGPNWSVDSWFSQETRKIPPQMDGAQRNRIENELSRKAKAWKEYAAWKKRDAERKAAAPARSGPPSAEGGEKNKASILTPDGYVDGVDDAKLALLRLMFRPQGLNESQLKAWDAVYFGGTFWGSTGKSSRASAERSHVKEVKEQLEAMRAIEKMLRKDSGSLTWRESPTNIGLVFLTPQFKSALMLAYERIKNVCGKQHVPLIDLMTHENVYVYFAKLVACEMAEQSYRFPGRYMQTSYGSKVEEERYRLLAVFKSLEYNLSGYLVFSSTYDALAEGERRTLVAMRKRTLETTGRYHSDRYYDSDSRGYHALLPHGASSSSARSDRMAAAGHGQSLKKASRTYDTPATIAEENMRQARIRLLRQ